MDFSKIGWLCQDCADKLGRHLRGIHTFHVGQCEMCLEERTITNIRNYSKPTIEFAEDDLVQANYEDVRALLELFDIDIDKCFISNETHFADFVSSQAELDEILPIHVDQHKSLLQGIILIRAAVPNWPNQNENPH